MKKSLISLFSFIIIGLAFYIIIGPYLAIDGIRSSIKENDTDRLSAYVEFDLLRKNLKEQFNATMLKNSNEEIQQNPFAMMMVGVASQLVDGLVDVYVTPSAIALLLEGERPAYTARSSSMETKPTKHERVEPLKEYRTKFVSTDRFYIYTKDTHGKEITIVLQRFGLEWKITNIILPDLQ